MVKPGQAGIRSYAIGLSRALGERPDLRVTVLVAANNQDDWGQCEVVCTKLRNQDFAHRLVWRAKRVPDLVRWLGADALLVLAPEPVTRGSVSQGIVIHDLGPLLAPAVYGRRRFFSYLATIRRAIHSVDHVFTPSHATKLDVLRWAGAGQSVSVAGPILRPFDQGEEDQRNRPKHPDRGSFALYVGALLPHKNVSTVVRAFGSSVVGTGCIPPRLVIVGPDYGGEVEKVMAHAGNAVEHRGFVAQDELNELYDQAAVLVFPSLFEGFGLPLLEALSRGTPTLASAIPALLEVGRDVTAYVTRPTDVDAWLEGLDLPRSPSPGGLVSWDGAAEAIAVSFQGGNRSRIA